MAPRRGGRSAVGSASIGEEEISASTVLTCGTKRCPRASALEGSIVRATGALRNLQAPLKGRPTYVHCGCSQGAPLGVPNGSGGITESCPGRRAFNDEKR